MREERAREHSPGFWPTTVDKSAQSKEMASSSSTARQGNKELKKEIVLQSDRNLSIQSATKSLVKSVEDGRRKLLRRTSTSSWEQDDNDEEKGPPPAHQSTSPKPSSPAAPPEIRLVSTNDYGSNSDGESDDSMFVSCPLDECGEQVLVTEINDHIERHQAEQLVLDGDDPSSSIVRRQSLEPITSQHQQHTNHSQLFNNDLPSYSNIESPTIPGPNLSHSYYAPEKPKISLASGLADQQVTILPHHPAYSSFYSPSNFESTASILKKASNTNMIIQSQQWPNVASSNSSITQPHVRNASSSKTSIRSHHYFPSVSPIKLPSPSTALVIPASSTSKSVPSSPRSGSPTNAHNNPRRSYQGEDASSRRPSKRHSQLGQAWGSVREKVLSYGLENPVDVVNELLDRSSKPKKGSLRLGVSTSP